MIDLKRLEAAKSSEAFSYIARDDNVSSAAFYSFVNYLKGTGNDWAVSRSPHYDLLKRGHLSVTLSRSGLSLRHALQVTGSDFGGCEENDQHLFEGVV